MPIVKSLWRLVPFRRVLTLAAVLVLGMLFIGSNKDNPASSPNAGAGPADQTVHSATGAAGECSPEEINANKQLGLQMLTARQRQSEWTDLEALWDGVHGWCHKPVGRTGHCGIPQGPCAQVGVTPNSQIQWGLDYIQSRYGTAPVALAYWKCSGRCSFTHAQTKRKVTTKGAKAAHIY